MTETRKVLLLTDVIDGDRLSEELGDTVMAGVWSAHDRVARDLLPLWRGREIDKTEGILLMFDRVADAVGYALAYHRALRGLRVPLSARAGLHIGPVLLRENRADDVLRGAKPLEVDGLAKPTAARVMSLAQGGQTLMTTAARDALGATDLRLQSHGHWIMKGVSEPAELFEVGDAQARFQPPPDGAKVYRVVHSGGRWLPVSEIPRNLPQPATSFVGRERELDELRDLLGGDARLVTLLGMGGLGKTRLSLQAADAALPAFPDGAWFVDLSPIVDATLVPVETARVLGVDEEPGRPLLASLCAHLRAQRALIILDNCEHLIDAVRALAQALSQAAPGLRLLASSRIALGLDGEHVFPIHPLPLPARGDDLRALAGSTAVRLFVDRVQANRPDFLLEDQDPAEVGELVARLEGIPLAIELAAARMRTLELAEINAGLAQRFEVLTGGSRRLQARQQTLRALVDWSYDLLAPDEQTLLQRLAVFAGGFDLEAVQAVCADEGADAAAVAARLASLVDKSLVTPGQRAGQMRHRMLETIRDYAADRLAEAGATAAAAARHCSHFFALSKLGRDGLQGPLQREWLDRLETEQDNLRAAMALAQSEGSGVDPFIAVKMAVALQNFWIMRGGAGEGRALVRTMLAHPAVAASAMARAHALYVGAALACTQGELEDALQMLLACLELRRSAGSSFDVAATLSTLAVTRLSSGDIDGAGRDGLEAVVLFRACGFRVGEAIALAQLGQVEAQRGHATAAREHLRAALAIADDIGHPETAGEAELVLGEVALEAGDTAAAQGHFERSLAVCAGAGDRRGEATATWALGRLDLRAGRFAPARARLHEALLAFEGFEMRGAWLGCLEDLAALAALAEAGGDATLACALLAYAGQQRERARLVRAPQVQRRIEQLLGALQAALGPDAFETARRAALSWEAPEVRRRVSALEVAPAVAG